MTASSPSFKSHMGFLSFSTSPLFCASARYPCIFHLISMTLHPLHSTVLSSQSNLLHGFFTREGGISTGPYASLNCSLSQDTRANVVHNRTLVAHYFHPNKSTLYIPRLYHSNVAVYADSTISKDEEQSAAADAVVTTEREFAIGVLGADCPPVLFADLKAGVIGAAHAGWRGAVNGVLENVVKMMEEHGGKKEDIVAAVGPGIQQAKYEVGWEFYERFVKENKENEQFFQGQDKNVKPMFDLPGFIGEKLNKIGIGKWDNVGVCTFDDDRLFSYRRNVKNGIEGYGCQASVIMLE